MLRDVLEVFAREQPDHPLVAVFMPLIAEDHTLEVEAAQHYRTLVTCELSTSAKSALQEALDSKEF